MTGYILYLPPICLNDANNVAYAFRKVMRRCKRTWIGISDVTVKSENLKGGVLIVDGSYGLR